MSSYFRTLIAFALVLISTTNYAAQPSSGSIMADPSTKRITAPASFWAAQPNDPNFVNAVTMAIGPYSLPLYLDPTYFLVSNGTNVGLSASLLATINAKASAVHQHSESDITNLVSDLAAKASLTQLNNASNALAQQIGNSGTGNSTNFWGKLSSTNLPTVVVGPSEVKCLTNFLADLSAAGIGNNLVELCVLKPQFNSGANPATLAGTIGTNFNSPVYTSQGLRLNSAGGQKAVWPMPNLTNFTIVAVVSGPTNLGSSPQQLLGYQIRAAGSSSAHSVGIVKGSGVTYGRVMDQAVLTGQAVLKDHHPNGVASNVRGDDNLRVWTITSDGTNVNFFLEGIWSGGLSVAGGISPSTQTYNLLSFGDWWSNGSATPSDSTLAMWCFFNRALTTNEIVAVNRATTWFENEELHIFIGDSRTAPVWMNNAPDSDYPSQLMALTPFAGKRWINEGVPGEYGCVVASSPTYLTESAYLWRPGGKITRAVAHVNYGANDFFAGTNGPTLYGAVSNICRILKGWGFEVWLQTERSSWGGTAETAFNAMLTTNGSPIIADHLVRRDLLWTVADESNPAIFSDGVHMTPAGCVQLAQFIKTTAGLTGVDVSSAQTASTAINAINATNFWGRLTSTNLPPSIVGPSDAANMTNFLADLSAVGVKNNLVELCVLKPQFNSSTNPVTLAGTIGTNLNAPVYTSQGLRLNSASNQKAVWPLPNLTNFTIMAVISGPTNLGAGAQQLLGYQIRAAGVSSAHSVGIVKGSGVTYGRVLDQGVLTGQAVLTDHHPNATTSDVRGDDNLRVWTITSDGTNVNFFLEGLWAGRITVNGGISPSTQTYDLLSFGDWWSNGAATPADATLSMWAFFNRALTTNEVAAVARATTWFENEELHFFIGDSRTAPVWMNSTPSKDYPSQLMQLAPFAGKRWINEGVPGEIGCQVAASPTYLQESAYLWRPGGKITRAVAHVQYGANDFFYGTNGPTLYNAVSNICRTLKGWGFEVWLQTERSQWGGGAEAVFNSMITTNAGQIADHIVRRDLLWSTADEGNTAIFTDGIHMTPAACLQLAQYVKSGAGYGPITADTLSPSASLSLSQVPIRGVTASGAATASVNNGIVNIDVSASGGGDATQAGNNTFSGNNTHSGSETFSGTVSGTGFDTAVNADADARIVVDRTSNQSRTNASFVSRTWSALENNAIANLPSVGAGPGKRAYIVNDNGVIKIVTTKLDGSWNSTNDVSTPFPIPVAEIITNKGVAYLSSVFSGTTVITNGAFYITEPGGLTVGISNYQGSVYFASGEAGDTFNFDNTVKAPGLLLSGNLSGTTAAFTGNVYFGGTSNRMTGSFVVDGQIQADSFLIGTQQMSFADGILYSGGTSNVQKLGIGAGLAVVANNLIATGTGGGSTNIVDSGFTAVASNFAVKTNLLANDTGLTNNSGQTITQEIDTRVVAATNATVSKSVTSGSATNLAGQLVTNNVSGTPTPGYVPMVQANGSLSYQAPGAASLPSATYDGDMLVNFGGSWGAYPFGAFIGISNLSKTASAIQIASIPLPTNTAANIFVRGLARGSTNTMGQELKGTFVNSNGVISQVGALFTNLFTASTAGSNWFFAFNTSGSSNVVVTGTGISAETINWRAAGWAGLLTIPTEIPLISGINVSFTNSTNATIAWTTDQSASSKVEYGTTTGYGTTTNLATLLTSHSIGISNLTASTTYHYRVSSTNANGQSAVSADQVFATAAAGGGACVVQQQNDGVTWTRSFGGPVHPWAGQARWVDASPHSICKLSFKVSENATGYNFVAEIHGPANPNYWEINPTPLATSQTVAGANWATPTWLDFTFSTPYTTTGGNEYFLLIKITSPMGSDNVALYGDGTALSGYSDVFDTTGVSSYGSGNDASIKIWW